MCTRWPYLRHAHARDLVAWAISYAAAGAEDEHSAIEMCSFFSDICAVSISLVSQVALREKRGQIERELRDFKQNYGPDKVNELRQQMEESIAELDQLKDQLRKSKMANRQQVRERTKDKIW